MRPNPTIFFLLCLLTTSFTHMLTTGRIEVDLDPLIAAVPDRSGIYVRQLHLRSPTLTLRFLLRGQS